MESGARASAHGGGFALGIDGGASRLKWSIRDARGCLKHGRAPGGNLQLLGWDLYLQCLDAAIRSALNAFGAHPGEVGSIGLGLSGVDRPAEIKRLDRWMRDRFPRLERRWIGNDALAALRSGVERLEGIVLIAGTGSICVGMVAGGRAVRVGGWGGALGDEGSGWWIGWRALNLAARMADGRITRTPLLDRLLDALDLRRPMDLIPWAARWDKSELKRRTAALAPLILRLDREGDPAARRIVRQAAGHLFQHALVAARKLDALERCPKRDPLPRRRLVCAGGLFSRSARFYSIFVDRLRHADRFDPLRLREPASLGALLLGDENPR